MSGIINLVFEYKFESAGIDIRGNCFIEDLPSHVKSYIGTKAFKDVTECVGKALVATLVVLAGKDTMKLDSSLGIHLCMRQTNTEFRIYSDDIPRAWDDTLRSEAFRGACDAAANRLIDAIKAGSQLAAAN